VAAAAPEPDRAPAPRRPSGIRRRDPADSPTSFAALRAEGLRWTQALSGRTWTDYNLHDPGVTILEQLCFALSELAYRVDFPVADHLAARRGHINFEQLALHGPAAALPCRPTTVDDYRRALLDTNANLDNAWVGTAVATDGPDAGVNGLYRIALKPADLGDEIAGLHDAVCADAQTVYRANRNLGEDLAAVASVAAVECDLYGVFVIGGSRSPEDILSDIYERCAETIAARVAFRPFGPVLASGRPIEELLNPRHTRHGVIADEDLRAAEREELFVGDLAVALGTVEGVRAVRELGLARAGEAPTTGTLRWNARHEALRLRVPGPQAMASMVRLLRAEGPVRASAEEVLARYRDLRANQAARRPGRQDIALHFPPPRGTHRDLSGYTSIQHHFPDAYGINARGVPAGASPEDRAHAAQLKAYLALFEGVLADGAAQLDHLRDLFSADPAVDCTYWRGKLDASVIPGLDAVLDDANAPRPPGDDFMDRRNRFIDHLLALHGESFPQSTLRQLARYYIPHELDRRLLANKLAYLQHVLRVGRDRAGAFDYGRPSWNDEGRGHPNVSGLQFRASLLLGLRHVHSRSLTADTRGEGLEVERPDAADREAQLVRGGTSMLASDLDGLWVPALEDDDGPPPRLAQLRESHGIRVFDGGRISEPLLEQGIDLGNYRVALVGDEHALMCLPEGAERCWLLSSHATAAAANRAANRLRRFLVELNREAEGLHVVEHVLLRPASAAAPREGALAASFFSLRVTVVIPLWTARGQDPAYRRFAEETVSLNCPSHLYSQCLWLDFVSMVEFERRWERWLAAKLSATRARADGSRQQSGQALAEVDEAGLAVAAFLLEQGVPLDAGDRHA
jgi:hypothetical protein